jgi:hypothetical protein
LALRINIARIRRALEITAKRCDPDDPARGSRGSAAFGAALLDVEDGTTQHQLLLDALTEVDKLGIDEIYDYPDC